MVHNINYYCRYENWKPHSGPVDLSYETNTRKRQRKKWDRRHGVVKKAQQLTSVCGGKVFLRYEDEEGNIYTYTNSEKLWTNYSKEGLKQNSNEKRLDKNGSVIKLEKFGLKININSYVKQNMALNEIAIVTTVTPVEKLPQDATALDLTIANSLHNAIVDQPIPVSTPEAGEVVIDIPVSKPETGEVIIETGSSDNTGTVMLKKLQNKPSINSEPKQKTQFNLKRFNKHNKLKPPGTKSELKLKKLNKHNKLKPSGTLNKHLKKKHLKKKN
jgi:hypothetical protein